MEQGCVRGRSVGRLSHLLHVCQVGPVLPTQGTLPLRPYGGTSHRVSYFGRFLNGARSKTCRIESSPFTTLAFRKLRIHIKNMLCGMLGSLPYSNMIHCFLGLSSMTTLQTWPAICGSSLVRAHFLYCLMNIIAVNNCVGKLWIHRLSWLYLLGGLS